MNTSILWGHIYVVMGWNAGKTTFECAEPQDVSAPVPGTDCTLAVVQMCWIEERPGGKASGLRCLFRSCGWMMLGQINCTQDFPFQKTLGNVRWQQGRVILTRLRTAMSWQVVQAWWERDEDVQTPTRQTGKTQDREGGLRMLKFFEILVFQERLSLLWCSLSNYVTNALLYEM